VYRRVSIPHYLRKPLRTSIPSICSCVSCALCVVLAHLLRGNPQSSSLSRISLATLRTRDHRQVRKSMIYSARSAPLLSHLKRKWLVAAGMSTVPPGFCVNSISYARSRGEWTYSALAISESSRTRPIDNSYARDALSICSQSHLRITRHRIPASVWCEIRVPAPSDIRMCVSMCCYTHRRACLRQVHYSASGHS